jgi:membrane associated rhomboid family serine protease
VVNVPWPVLALIAVLLAAHVARLWLGLDMDRLALSSGDLSAGRWSGLFTSLFVHVSWVHVLVNSLFILALGAPVARFLGVGPRGALVFFAFFLVCGLVAGAGYAAIASALAAAHLGAPDWALVGASGAASGFLGAAGRLIEGRGRLGPMLGRTVVGMSLVWIALNATLGLTGLTPGLEGGAVAWEAHIVGYFAGLFLIAPFAAAAGVHKEMTQ